MSYFDRFDICAAYNMFAVLWGGDYQGYANQIATRLHAIAYRPAASEQTLEGLSENAKEIYGALVRQCERDYIAYERLHRRAPHVFPVWPGTRNAPNGTPRGLLFNLGFNPETLIQSVCP